MSEGKYYDPHDDLWHDRFGRVYIRNEFDPGNPKFIDISTSLWEVNFVGVKFCIDWDSLSLPPGIVAPLRMVTQRRMKRQSPRFLGTVNRMLCAIEEYINPEWPDFGAVTIADIAEIWEATIPSYRVIFRNLYSSMANSGIGGASQRIALELSSWAARSNVSTLKHVMNWHETKGAFTASEERLLRAELQKSLKGYETDKEHAARIYAWLILETFKRPSQILDIRTDGLKRVEETDGTVVWHVAVKPVKHQTGRPYRWWRISSNLATEIIDFSERESVAKLQKRFNRLLVWDVRCLYSRDVVSVADANSALRSLIEKKNLISPRTGKPLHVAPLRIRHTCATRLAAQGIARDIIQELLEHDSPESAQAYIDAVGSDIIPIIERAGRRMGNIFYELNKACFQGKITYKYEDALPLLVPGPCSTPLIVGSCGMDVTIKNKCKKHPFLMCYDGCGCFLAWADLEPHAKARTYFEKEVERWAKYAPDNQAAHAAMLSNQRAADAAQEIINSIGGN